MSWQLQSDRSGKVYDFDDNVSQEDALKYLDSVLEPPQSWSNTLSTIPRAAQARFQDIQQGVLQFGEDVIRKPLLRTFNALADPFSAIQGQVAEPGDSAVTQQAKEYAKATHDALRQETTGVPTLSQQAAQTAGVSLLTTLPDIVSGAGAARGLLSAGKPIGEAVGTGIQSALKSLSGQEGMAEFGAQREAGQDLGTALAAGTTSAAAEYLGETVAFAPLKRIIVGGDPKLRATIYEFLFKDLAGEELTTAIQALNRKLTREPDMTLDDFVREMQITAISSAISGPTQAAVMRPVGALTMAGVPKGPEREKIDPTIGEPTSEGPAPLPDIPELGEDQVVQPPRGKTQFVLDSELPVIGQTPGDSQDISRDLPPELQIEFLRRAWDDYNNKSATDSAEERIRRRQNFIARRAKLEESLRLVPEARALLRESDMAMGITLPSIENELEQEVDEYALLDDAEIMNRRLLRSQGQGTSEMEQYPRLPSEVIEFLQLPETTPINQPYNEEMLDRPASSLADYLEHRQVVDAVRPELKGLSFSELQNELQPGEAVFLDVPENANVNGAPWLLNQIREWQKTWLPDRKLVMIGTPVRESGNFQRLSAAYVIDGTYVMHVPLPTSMNRSSSMAESVEGIGEQMTQMRIDDDTIDVFDTIAHEFGHFIHFRHWEDSPASEKRAVAKQYYDELASLKNMTFDAGVKMLYSAKTAEGLLTRFQAVTKQDPKKVSFEQAMAMSFGKLAPFNKKEYWLNFNEWLAHKTSKYMFTRLGAKTETLGFFKRLLLKFQQFYNQFVKSYNPGRSFSEWIDNIAARESGMVDTLTPSQIEKAKRDLIAQGIDPDLAALLSEVRGNDRGLIDRFADRYRDNAEVSAGIIAENRDLERIGNLIGSATKLADFKSLQHMGIVRDLGKEKGFAKRKQFPVERFFDAILSTIVNSKNVVETGEYGKRFFTFHGKAGRVSVMYNPQTKSLVAGFNSDYGTAQSKAVTVGLLNYVMRKLAQDGVREVVNSSSLASFYSSYDSETNRLEIPYYLYSPPARPNNELVETSMLMPQGLSNLGKSLNLPWLQSSANQLARFNAFFNKALGAFQMIKLNEHLPGMVQEREALRNRMAYRHKWLAQANERVETWAFGIDKTEAAKIGRLLFEEAESGKWLSTFVDDPNRPGHRVFTLDPKEIQTRKLSVEAQELYSNIRDDFMFFADEWHKVALWEVARNELTDVVQLSLAQAMRTEVPMVDYQKIFNMALSAVNDPLKAKRVGDLVKDINTEFDAWKSKPYMPFTRFGRYGVLVRDGLSGKTKYFAGFDTAEEARKEAEVLKKSFAADAVSTTYLEDVPYMLAGLPSTMVSAMKKTLNLTPAQEEQFGEILKRLSHANSFAHRSAKRHNIAGFSTDALRAYSDYFRRGSAFIARVKSEPELGDALGMLKKYINTQTAVGADVIKLGQLHEWFQRLHNYLNDPGTEYGEVKSFMSLFHFGFNASTAFVNLGQVWLATAPYLTERHDTMKVLNALKQAYVDMANFYFKGKGLSAEEQAMLDHAREEGFRDQSQATVLAQLADGSALARATPVSGWTRGLNKLNHYAMWMFSKGELLNRDVTLIATYRLNRQAPGKAKFDPKAYEQARLAVEDTHNEYERENRPEFMRGAGSVVFQFMHFTQNMLFMMFGGDASWWKLLAVQLMVGGALSLPFSEDMTNFVKFIGRKLGKDWDVQRETREYLHEMNIDADLVLRGLASDVFGMDLSRRISFGEVIPGMRALGSHRKFDQVMYDAIGDAGGPAVSLVMNGLKFVSEDDPLAWKALKGILPTSMKNIGNATTAFVEGEVTDRSGAKVLDPSTWEITGMAVGFQPERLTAQWNIRSMQSEQAAFWTQRRHALLEMWGHIVLDRKNDRETVADFMQRLKVYNASAPDPKLRISGDTLRQSVKSRIRSRQQREQGMGATGNMPNAALAIKELYQSE